MENIVPILILGGIAWWLWRRRQANSTSQPKQVFTCTGRKRTTPVQPTASAEEQIAALHKQATELKSMKAWDSAIKCLEEANTLLPKVSISYPIKHFLRLPLFLQQGGYFEASMKEFQRLLNETAQRVARHTPHQKKTTPKMLAHAEYAEIYKSMGTACRREKSPELAEENVKKAAEHKAKHAQMLEAEFASRKK